MTSYLFDVGRQRQKLVNYETVGILKYMFFNTVLQALDLFESIFHNFQTDRQTTFIQA